MRKEKLVITFLISLIMNTLYAQENEKTFPPSDKVTVESVRFKNRFH